MAVLILAALSASEANASASGVGNAHGWTVELTGHQYGLSPHDDLVRLARPGGGRGQPIVHHAGPLPEFHIFPDRPGSQPRLPRPALADHAKLRGFVAALPGRVKHKVTPMVCDCATFQQALRLEFFGQELPEYRLPLLCDVAVALLHARAPPGA